MRTFRRLSLFTALALLLVARAEAQSVRGSVRDSATAAGISGAVVTGIDSNGAVIARSITNISGDFSVSLPVGAATLHVVRIGFSPRDAALSTTSRDQPVRITMRRLPPLLEAVCVSGRELCPGSADRGDAFALWEQAKAGLLATVVARDANPAIVTTLIFERREGATDSLVHQQVVRVHNGKTTTPFIAPASPESLAKSGYMKEVESSRLFYAPDADVLLSDSFAATHCFRIQTSDAVHAGQIGLAFAPMQGLSHTVDIAGAIWTDREAPALASVDFRYTGVQDAGDHGPSGHIEFRTAANGLAFVERWNIRIPILVYQAAAAAVRLNGRQGEARQNGPTSDETYVTGGNVVAARWADGTAWADEPSGLTGVVTEHGTRRPIAGVVTTIAGTADTSTTDDGGRFSFPLIPGRYTLLVRDTTLAAFARDRSDSKRVDVTRGKTADVTAELPAIGETVAQICKAKPSSANPAMLTGRVYFADEVTATSARIRVSWRIEFDRTLAESPLMKGLHELDREVDLDARGRFIVCGVAFEQTLNVHLTFDGGAADTTVAIRRTLAGSLEWKRP